LPDIEHALIEDFLDFMESFSHSPDPSIKNFVEEFDQIFRAFKNVKATHKNSTHSFTVPDPLVHKYPIDLFCDLTGLSITTVESPETYFQSVDELVKVNIPFPIILQDVLRVSEKSVQKGLDELHRMLKANRVNEAKNLLDLLIVIAPDYPHLWIFRGILLFHENKRPQSIESLMISVFQAPFSLYGLVPLLVVLCDADPKIEGELLKWFIEHKDKFTIDYDTPPSFKKAILESTFPKKEDLLSCLPKGLGSRYNFLVQKQEYHRLKNAAFPKSLLDPFKNLFDDTLEKISPSSLEPTMRFFLKIIQKPPEEIDKTVSSQNLYLHSLALVSRGFFLGLKIPHKCFHSQKDPQDLIEELLSASLLLSFLFTLLVLLEKKDPLLLKMDDPFKKLLYFMSNSLPLSNQLRDLKLIDALILDIIERI
jgi:hypothetical protein